MSFQISPQLLHIYTSAFPQFSPALALSVKPPEFVSRLSDGLMCHWTPAGTEPLSGLLFASWFLSSLKDTSTVHHLLGRVLLFEPWGWHRGSTTSLLSPIHSFTICRDHSSPSPSCPLKQPADLEEYALEGNAAWITVWHVWFLTYFLCMHLVLWFLSSHFAIPVPQNNLGQLSQNSIHCVPAAAWTFCWHSCGQ